jgi:CheY-like chemotaxis protein
MVRTEASSEEEVMETLLRRIGDEVRETLHQIMGLMDLITEEPLSERQSQYLARSRASADQLLCGANDLAELARVELPSAEPSPFRVESTVEEIDGLMRLLAVGRGAAFHWRLEANLPAMVHGNARLLQDLLRRIIETALRMAPGGEVHLAVRMAGEHALAFEITAAAAGAALSDPDFATPEGLGSALGLSIVRKRLGQLGGDLTTAVEDRRATLRMTIPYRSAAQPEAHSDHGSARNAPQDGSANSPLNVLIAEDSDDSYFLIEAYLANEGHRLRRALDGAQALDMAKSGSYDFIVMDIKMPVMDGYTATRLIREWETEQGCARLPILLLSAEEAARQMRIGANAGCSGYLTKPATKAQVLAALNYYARPDTRAASR